jgi:hypothetical protein
VKKLLLILVLLVPATTFAEVPTVNIPPQCREANWVDPITLEGSCVFATQTMSFRWMLDDVEANYWRATFSGGEYADDSWHYGSNLARKFDARDIPYAYSLDGDPAFLTWSLSTRRPCGVTTNGGKHMQLLVHFDDEWAALIDNNSPSQINWVPRDRFLHEWWNSNSWAVTILESPCPPLPKRSSE